MTFSKRIKKNETKTERERRYKNTLTKLQNRMNDNEKRLNTVTHEKGVSNWLTSYPISDHGFDLTKQQFCDSLRIRYGWELTNIPSS